MATEIKLNFPFGHLGASPSDDPICLLIRAFCKKHFTGSCLWAEPDKYGINYEDDQVQIHVYSQFPECGCHVEREDQEWQTKHPHKRVCFVSVAGALVKRLEKEHPLPKWDPFYVMDLIDAKEVFEGLTEEEKRHQDARRSQHESSRSAYCAAYEAREKAVSHAVYALSKERRVRLSRRDASWEWEYRCTCGRDRVYEAFQKAQRPHERPCDLWWASQPNFLYKPTGLEARWYKYVGRDMEYNREEITCSEWEKLSSLVTAEDIRGVVEEGEARRLIFEKIIFDMNKREKEALA